jgi:hypothetical protein
VTRRQLRRRARRHPILATLAMLAGLALLVGPVVLGAVLRDVLSLVILAAVGVGGYYTGKRSRPVARARMRTAPAREITAERDQLRRDLGTLTRQLAGTRGELDQASAAGRQLLADCTADMGRLRAELGSARASAQAAWDAAAERPPARRTDPGDAGGKRAAILGDPCSGARPLVPS